MADACLSEEFISAHIAYYGFTLGWVVIEVLVDNFSCLCLYTHFGTHPDSYLFLLLFFLRESCKDHARFGM